MTTDVISFIDNVLQPSNSNARIAAALIVRDIPIYGFSPRETTDKMQEVSTRLEKIADRDEVHAMMIRYYHYCAILHGQDEGDKLTGILLENMLVDLHFGNELDDDRHEYTPK